MDHELNGLGQPIGLVVNNWKPPPHPGRTVLQGHLCRLEPLGAQHVESLYAANAQDREERNWTYLSHGPFDNLDEYRAWIEPYFEGNDPLFYAIVDLEKEMAVGVASYLRIGPSSGSIEVGHINYSPLLQRRPAASEAMYLMMAHAFDLGYRRYEWKCNSLNAPSRNAAQRLGFSFEGVFRQATIAKGRNRDTAWYAIMDHEWPAIKEAFLQWLSLDNFDAHGQQKMRLSTLTAPLLRRNIVDMNL